VSRNNRHDLETEAGCRLALTGGMAAGTGNGYGYVNLWMDPAGVQVPPCRDGIATNGDLDRLGRPMQRGRGLGMFDDLWPVAVVAGSIVEMVPVNFKGSRSSPYANTDLTSGKWDLEAGCPVDETPLAAFMAAVESALPIWVCLLTEVDGVLMMRRADACKVWRAVAERGLTYRPSRGVEKGHEVSVARLRESGTGKYKGRYRRVSIQWKHVPSDLWLDQDWRPFDATAPIPVHYLD